MAITIKEIAQLANVSASTVSMVLNNKEGIGQETRNRVIKIAKEKGYSPTRKANSNIGSLQLSIYKKHSKVVNDSPFFQALIEGIESEARHNSYKLNIAYISKSSDAQIVLNEIKNHSISGMLLLGTEMDHSDFIKYSESDVPLVLLDSSFVDINSNCVAIDNISGTYKAAKYLIEKGHTNIGYLKSSIVIQNFKERFEGFKRALSEYGINYNLKHTLTLMPNMEESYVEMSSFLDGNPSLPTAYIADNDLIAMGVFKALKEHSIKIPDQISIIGFDDMPFCKMTEPALTTVNVNKKIFGRLAVDNLIDIIEGKNKSTFKTLLGVNLIQRNSVMNIKEK